ncbi:hypothetical protein M3Y94_00371300 [Aphelenchoides besseyi]|nr:hypothetical protein M3Y94_00371300 [Aphelenchoides besseyi]
MAHLQDHQDHQAELDHVVKPELVATTENRANRDLKGFEVLSVIVVQVEMQGCRDLQVLRVSQASRDRAIIVRPWTTARPHQLLNRTVKNRV